MDIRVFTLGDLKRVEEIHAKYFAEEFELPNFSEHFMGSFIVEDNKEIIVAGGVRVIAELIAVTDMAQSVKKRVQALKEATRAGMFLCKMNNLDQLHCFVQGDKWANQVQTVNFRPTKGQALVIDVG